MIQKAPLQASASFRLPPLSPFSTYMSMAHRSFNSPRKVSAKGRYFVTTLSLWLFVLVCSLHQFPLSDPSFGIFGVRMAQAWYLIGTYPQPATISYSIANSVEGSVSCAFSDLEGQLVQKGLPSDKILQLVADNVNSFTDKFSAELVVPNGSSWVQMVFVQGTHVEGHVDMTFASVTASSTVTAANKLHWKKSGFRSSHHKDTFAPRGLSPEEASGVMIKLRETASLALNQLRRRDENQNAEL